MSNIKLTQLEKTSEFEGSLLYGVDKNGISKAFDANALSNIQTNNKRDIFKESEELQEAQYYIFDNNKPSKIRCNLSSCYIETNNEVMYLNLSTDAYGQKFSNSNVISLNWKEFISNNNEFSLVIPFYGNYNIDKVIFAHKFQIPNLQLLSLNNEIIKPSITDESFDTEGYDSMYLIKEDMYEAKRLTERNKAEEIPVSSFYLKGRKLYSTHDRLGGYMISTPYFMHLPQTWEYDLEETYTESVFGLFPGVYLKTAWVEYDKVKLHFQKNSFTNFEDNNGDSWYNNPGFSLEEFYIPNIHFDLFLHFYYRHKEALAK